MRVWPFSRDCANLTDSSGGPGQVPFVGRRRCPSSHSLSLKGTFASNICFLIYFPPGSQGPLTVQLHSLHSGQLELTTSLRQHSRAAHLMRSAGDCMPARYASGRKRRRDACLLYAIGLYAMAMECVSNVICRCGPGPEFRFGDTISCQLNSRAATE